MNTQLVICIVIFVLTLASYLLNKIPMWVTAMISMSALYITGCIDASGALAGFANVNTILMAAMFVVAAGFRRTSLVDALCSFIMKITRGSFEMAYLGYLIIALILTNFIASPMVVYAIVSTLLCAYLDTTGKSRSKYIFPMMVVCVSCCGILPLSTAIQQAGQFTGFLETYGFDMVYEPTYFFIAGWPMLIVVPLWALFIGPKFLPEQPPLPIAAKEEAKQQKGKVLSPMQDKLGIAIFFLTIICLIFSGQLGVDTWFIALVGSLLMVVCGVVDQKSALRDIPWDMILLYVGALALGANPIGLMALVQAGSLTAFMTPMATPAVPLAMADGGYDLKTIMKGGAVISVIIPVIYILYTMTVLPPF